MKELLLKYKKKLITAVIVAVIGAGIYLSGGTVDWAQLAAEASKGEVTNAAQTLEDLAKEEAPAE